MNIVVPNEREHIIQTAIVASGDNILNYYIFKDARVKNKYIALFEEDATMEMQKKVGWIANSHNGWIIFYTL